MGNHRVAKPGITGGEMIGAVGNEMEKTFTSIREYAEGFPVTIKTNDNGRLVIVALNEGGHNGVEIDLLDVIKFYNRVF